MNTGIVMIDDTNFEYQATDGKSNQMIHNQYRSQATGK